jgi:ATP-dependent exoDNAse (exonuclease V) beta subunit
VSGLTPAQRRAVEAGGRDLCVVAGAGSGKTTVLAERFAHLALRGRAPRDRLDAVERLLALTFTEKAATEMRERAAARFLREGLPELRRAVETAWVSTFHSFCARLLKENAVEAGVDPAFRVLGEGDAGLLLEEARAAAVARAAEERPEDLGPLGEIATGDLEGVVDGLLADGPSPAPSFAALLAGETEAPDPGPGLADLRQALDDLAAGVPSYSAAGADRARLVLGAAGALPRGRPGADALPALAAAVDAVLGEVNLRPGGRAREDLRAVREAGEVLARALLGLRAAPAARALAALLDDAAAEYARLKAAHGALDFADLEARALRLLESDPDARDEARERFDAVLVDEFQDTNPVQERLLDLVARPGRRFAVGDPKQAIYGFRGASVEGFARARAAAGEEGTVLLVENFRSRPEILRFSNAVLAPAFAAGGDAQVPFERLEPGADHGPKAIPSVEAHLVGGEGVLGDLRPREATLVAARIRALVGGEIRITRKDPEGRVEDRVPGWGDAAVLLRATTDVKVYERALADADVPYQVVKGRGFYEAREVVDLANLLEALEDPRHDLALACALRSPFAGLDDGALLALVDALPSADGARAPLSSLLAPGARTPRALRPGMRRRFERFRGTWAALLDLRRRGRLHDLVEAALGETGYDLAILLLPGGRQRAANLRKVRERARSFEAAGLGGPGEFVRLLRRLRLREERETEAPLAAGDAVSLLTVHQAKGLEWPVVCLPDLGRRGPAAGGPVLVRGGRAGLRLRGARDPVPTALWEALRDEEERAGDAEEVRLFHVALTRAKEHLVLSACVKGEGDLAPAEDEGRRRPPRTNALRVLAPLLAGAPAEGGAIVVLAGGTPDEVAVRVTRGEGPAPERLRAGRTSLAAMRRKRLLAGRGPGARLPARERRAAEEEVARVLDLPPVPLDGTPYLATVSAVLDFAACPLRYFLRHAVGAPDRASGPAGDEDGARAPRGGEGDEEALLAAAPGHGVPRWVSGVAVHAVLGTMDLASDGEDAVRTAARERLAEAREEEPPDAAVEEVVGWVRGFRASPVGREVAEAQGRRELHREVPFLAKGEGVLLRGQIDLLWRDARGEWTVGDYKATRPARRRGPATGSRYERQLHLYALALAATPVLGGAPPARGALVHLDPATEVVPVPMGEEPLAAARALLARFAAATAADRFPPDRSHCPRCPFGPGGTGTCAAAAGRRAV